MQIGAWPTKLHDRGGKHFKQILHPVKTYVYWVLPEAWDTPK